MTDYTWVDAVDPTELHALLAAVSAVDGRPSLPTGGALPGEYRGGRYLQARRDDELVGCAHLNAQLVAELVVRPDARGHGIGTELASRLLSEGDGLRIWAHGDQQAAAAIAARLGLRRVREMRRLRRPLTDDDLPPVSLPDGIRLRAFEPGRDEDAVTEVNRLAFAWHPEQGAMTAADVRASETESWFDAPGFLVAVDTKGTKGTKDTNDAADPADRVVGFHWTKVHPDAGDGAPIGEVYVVGVRPDAQGGGLGRGLTAAGLRYLRDRRGMNRVMLYVESDNEPALAVYDRLGFTLWDMDVQYAR